MSKSLISAIRVQVLIIVSVAMVATGFAHNTRAAAYSPDIVAFLAAGGSLADVCGGTQDGSETGHPYDCEICRIAQGLHLTATPNPEPSLTLATTLICQFVAKRLHNAKPLDPARLTRAPPFQA